MGRKNKKGSGGGGGGGGRKPLRPAGAAAPTNADWEDSTAAFRKEAESAIRALSDDGGAAAARLAVRHPASPLAHHVLGHARASAARAGDAVPALRRAAELAPRCPGIAATLASALLYARRPREALEECARALAVPDPTDPALHAAAAAEEATASSSSSSRRGALTAPPSPQARVAAARERLLGVRADAEALEATGALHGAAPLPPVMPPTKMNCCCRHATKRSSVADDDLRGFLTVSFDDLTAHCHQAGSVHLLTMAVEFAKATKAWAYWLCPVCDKVFLDASSFVSHVEGEYIHELQELQPLMPKRAALDSEEFEYSLKWTPFEMGEEDPERRKNLDKIKQAFAYINVFKALPVGLIDKVIKLARGRSKKPLPYCIPSCVTSLDCRELQRLVKPLEQVVSNLSRGWGFVSLLAGGGKSNKGPSDVISLIQDGSLLSLDAEKIVSRKKDGSCEEDALFRWLLNSMEEVAMPWASLRQKCVHHGNEVLESIYEISDLLLRQWKLKCAAKEKNHRGYSLTEADYIDVEMLLLDNEVSYLKNKLVEVCTFDYSAAILPLIRTYIWDKFNNDSPGEDLHDGDDKDAANIGDGSDSLHDESLFEDKIPDTDSDMHYVISRTDECENSSLSLSDSSNLSTVETESSSIDSGVCIVLHITAEELHVFNVTLRALWHLREFHDRFLSMPVVLPHFTVEVHCIICLLRKTFNAWDNEKEYEVNTFPTDVATAFNDIWNKHNICWKEGVNIASEIISIIFETLHKLCTSLDSDNATCERLISTTRCLDFVCVAHNVFGLPIREQNKCNCLNESSEEKEYITFFHSVNVSAIQTMEMKSLGQLLRDADKQNEYDTESCRCGNRTERSLKSAPLTFAVVFNWAIDKERYINMSEMLMNITTPLQFDLLYEVLHREDYTLATAVCCVEEEHVCFARKEEKWIIYGSKTIEFADSWEGLLLRYRQRCLRPQILFFDRIR